VAVRRELNPVRQPAGHVLQDSVAQPASRMPTSQLRTSFVSASVATNVHASPAFGFFSAIFGVTFFALHATNDQISSICTQRAGTLRTVRSRYTAHAVPTSSSSRRIVPLATPVRRDVERTEHPSTKAEMTATRFATGRRFMVNPSYYTALACQAESDGFTKNP
jgi:hypothetical protein